MGSAKKNSGMKKIVITGIGGRLGRLVARRLHRLGTHQVVGIDRRKIRDLPKDIQHLQVDLRSRRARDVFRDGQVDAFIHLGLMHNPRKSSRELHSWNVMGTSQFLEHCADFNVRKVVFLSSADVYGPRPDNPQFLTEDAPLMASLHFPEIRVLVEADMQATSFFWKASGRNVETVILRPVNILGQVRNAASNYLRLKRIPVLLGFDPMVQVMHEQDVADAIVAALSPGVRGVLNLSGQGEYPLSVVVRETGKPTVTLPASAAHSAMGLLWRFHLTSFPVPELAHLMYTAMVDTDRARRVMGFRPRHSLRETVKAVVSGETLLGVERRA